MQTNIITGRSLFFILILGCAFIGCFWIGLEKLYQVWRESEEYSHAFLTIPVILYMAWLKREQLDASSGKWTFTGFIGLPLSCLFYYFAVLTDVNTLIYLTIFSALLSILIYLLGIESVTLLFTPLLLALLLIPVPEQLYIKLTFPLQLKVSQASEMIIRFFDIPLLRQGNVMHTPEKSFEVVEACSGLRSIITLLTLSIIMGYFMLAKTSSKIVLSLATLPAAILVNIIRVTGMILAYHFYQIDLVEGPMHTMVGLGVFALAFCIILVIQKGLETWEKR